MKAVFSLSGLLLFLLISPTVFAEQPGCPQCHGALTQGKFVHVAVTMGCSTCHSGIDARTVPHNVTNSNVKGLSATLPDLCFDCHDRSISGKKTVHGALGMGCTVCHTPHAGNGSKLLKAELPDLCYVCHDSSPFSRMNIHPPVAAGCSSCHLPHSSDNSMLLISPENELCGTCHDGKASGGHILAGYGLGDIHPAKNKPDPLRQGKDISCLSCHSPHSSTGRFLFTEAAQRSGNLCLQCHSKIMVKP